eukprot:6496274-Pyramimonas_sp.AAC.1
MDPPTADDAWRERSAAGRTAMNNVPPKKQREEDQVVKAPRAKRTELLRRRLDLRQQMDDATTQQERDGVCEHMAEISALQ